MGMYSSSNNWPNNSSSKKVAMVMVYLCPQGAATSELIKFSLGVQEMKTPPYGDVTGPGCHKRISHVKSELVILVLIGRPS